MAKASKKPPSPAVEEVVENKVETPVEEKQTTEENQVEETIIEPPSPAVEEVVENVFSHTNLSATSTLISSSSVAIGSNKQEKNTVSVVIEYPEDYKLVKHFKNGDIKEVSKEVAESFVKRGIAKYAE